LSLLDSSARTAVTWSPLYEEVQDVLRAIGSPLCEKSMFGVLQCAASSHRNKPWVPFSDGSLPFVHPFSF
jgi:hypothetical protein